MLATPSEMWVYLTNRETEVVDVFGPFFNKSALRHLPQKLCWRRHPLDQTSYVANILSTQEDIRLECRLWAQNNQINHKVARFV